jgi:hypothetical protein
MLSAQHRKYPETYGSYHASPGLPLHKTASNVSITPLPDVHGVSARDNVMQRDRSAWRSISNWMEDYVMTKRQRQISSSGLLFAVLFIGTLSAFMPGRADAYSFSVNGFGFGNVQVFVWCYPNAPPAPATYTAGTGNQFGASASLGPGLVGCNPATQISSSNGGLWQNDTNWTSAGGDTVDDHSLLGLVTPTSPLASGSLTISGSVTSSTTADFTISWSGSDAGVAAHLAWYEGGTLLSDELRVGAWSEMFSKTITSTGPIEDVVLIATGVAVSTVPIPPAVWLFTTGLLGLLGISRRRAAR